MKEANQPERIVHELYKQPERCNVCNQNIYAPQPRQQYKEMDIRFIYCKNCDKWRMNLTGAISTEKLKEWISERRHEVSFVGLTIQMKKTHDGKWVHYEDLINGIDKISLTV